MKKHQLNVCIKIARNGARTLAANPFSHPRALLYTNTHINQKLYYPFPSVSFSIQATTMLLTKHIFPKWHH